MANIGDKIQAAAEAALRHVLQHRETYLKAWVAETGTLPSDACLVEQTSVDGVRVQVALRREVAEAMIGPEQRIDPIRRAKTLLDALSDQEFLEAIDGRCLACGQKHLPCYCQRDE